MRVIHENSFTPSEVEHYRQVVFDNLTRGLRYVLDAMKDMGLSVQSHNLQHAELVERSLGIQEGDPYPPEYHEPLRQLWNDPNIQTAIRRGNEAALPEK